MEILKNVKINIFALKKLNLLFIFWTNIYIRCHLISRIQGTRESREINGSRILMGLQYTSLDR